MKRHHCPVRMKIAVGLALCLALLIPAAAPPRFTAAPAPGAALLADGTGEPDDDCSKDVRPHPDAPCLPPPPPMPIPPPS
jgi:hypothetical protein